MVFTRSSRFVFVTASEQALAALCTAKAAGMRTWLGCMVGSALNSLATAHLLGLAPAADLDGALLVEAASDDTGYRLCVTDDGVPTGDVQLPTAHGLA